VIEDISDRFACRHQISGREAAEHGRLVTPFAPLSLTTSTCPDPDRSPDVTTREQDDYHSLPR
jgi:hypothetical protein